MIKVKSLSLCLLVSFVIAISGCGERTQPEPGEQIVPAKNTYAGKLRTSIVSLSKESKTFNDQTINKNLTASDAPFYARFLFSAKNYVAYKLAMPKAGQYFIVIGANDFLSGKFSYLIRATITGRGHQPIHYKMLSREDKGRIFMIIMFNVKENDLYPGNYIFFEFRVDAEAFETLPDSDKKRFKDEIIGEIGFAEL